MYDAKAHMTEVWLLYLGSLILVSILVSIRYGPTRSQGIRRVVGWWPLWTILFLFVVVCAPVWAGAQAAAHRTARLRSLLAP